MKDMWMLRRHSTDVRIVRHCYDENGYQMPDNMNGYYVIDIGANVGAFSVLCAERGAFVFAYEPFPETYELLRQHTEQFRGGPTPPNGFVAVQELGLGLGGEARLWVHDSNMGGHSITEEVGPTYITIQTRTLVNIIDRCVGENRQVDVLKLDCEGAEIYAFPELIEGLHERVNEIVMEFHSPRDEQEAQRAALAPYYEAINIFQADWRLVHR